MTKAEFYEIAVGLAIIGLAFVVQHQQKQIDLMKNGGKIDTSAATPVKTAQIVNPIAYENIDHRIPPLPSGF